MLKLKQSNHRPFFHLLLSLTHFVEQYIYVQLVCKKLVCLSDICCALLDIYVSFQRRNLHCYFGKTLCLLLNIIGFGTSLFNANILPFYKTTNSTRQTCVHNIPNPCLQTSSLLKNFEGVFSLQKNPRKNKRCNTTCQTKTFEGLRAFLHPVLADLRCLPHLRRLGQRHLQQVD